MLLIYAIVVRRFMYLDINENDFSAEEKEKVPK